MSRLKYLLPYLGMLAACTSKDGFFTTEFGRYPTPEPKEPTERQRQLFREHKNLTEFTIQGHKVMAYSKKDAITRLVHQGLIKRKKKK